MAVVMVLSAGAAGVPPLNPAPDPQNPLTISIARAITALSNEAHAAWAKSQPWPRAQSDLAQTQALRVANDDLIRALHRRLDPTTPIEAYIKWQLLSFSPDLSKQPTEVYRRLIALMPDIKAQPEPNLPSAAPAGGGNGMTIGTSRAIIVGRQPIPGTNGGSRPILGTIDTATSTGGDSGPPFDPVQAQEQLAHGQSEAARANQSVLAYRDGLIPRLPQDGGVRLAAMIADLKSRIVAGDPSVPMAVDRLAAECRQPGAGLPISADWHGPILGGLRMLARLRTPVTDDIGIGDKGALAVRSHVVLVPPEALIDMIRGLNLAEEFAPKP
jgi:hypothetical protein